MQAGGSHTIEARVVRIFEPLAGSRELKRVGASVPTSKVTEAGWYYVLASVNARTGKA